MNVTSAEKYVNEMVEDEYRRNGNMPNALSLVSRRIRITTNQLNYIRRGKAKTCDINLFQAIRLAYLDHCQAQIEKFKRQYEGANDDCTQDLLIQAESLLEQIKEKRGDHV